MPPSPNGVLNVASAADVGDRPFHVFTLELAKERIRQEHSEWSDIDLNLERIRRAFLQGLMPASERIIMGRMSAGWERFLSGEPKSSSWAFTSLVCSTRLDARLGAVFDERSLV
jgi:hypothetical protein